jgi:monoamine oxidase
VFQLLCSSQSRETWADSSIGLGPLDLSLQVALPELDGRITTRVGAFKEVSGADAALATALHQSRPDRERLDWVSQLVARWCELRRTPAAERRIGLVLANYPTRNSRLANGVGLDTPASATNLLHWLADGGYALGEPALPADGDALIQRLLQGQTNDPESQHRPPLAHLPLDWLCRVGGSGGFEPWEASILHLAWTQAVAPQHETPEAWLVEGGAAQLAERLAAELGEALRLRAPVRAIEQDGGGVRVSHGASEAVRAAAAVVAIPPPLRHGIQFDPCLPPQWLGLLQRSPMGSMVKVLALYPRPFWRERGLNGLGIGNLPTLELTVDSSPPGGPGILAGFIAGERAVRWQRLGEAERRRAVLQDLVCWWGAEAAEPAELVLHNWNAEGWSGGAFTSFLTPGAWTTYGAIGQEPHGRVVWAGTEAASRWPGYFEGAIEAGLAAARRVRGLLGDAGAGAILEGR